MNWTRYDTPFNSGYLQFVDDNTGYLFQITGAAMNKQSVVLFKTTDGGATWTQKYNNDPTLPGASNTLPLGGHKDGITFSNATTGWIGGDIPVDGYFYFYKTSDSGVTWSRLQLAIPAGYESAYITTTAPKFFGPNDAILPVWMTIGIGMRDLFLYTTHNGGNTWTASPAFARSAQQTDIISMNNTISWDWTNIFHVTSNGGNSWTTVTPNVTFGDEFRQLDFVSPPYFFHRSSPLGFSRNVLPSLVRPPCRETCRAFDNYSKIRRVVRLSVALLVWPSRLQVLSTASPGSLMHTWPPAPCCRVAPSFL